MICKKDHELASFSLPTLFVEQQKQKEVFRTNWGSMQLSKLEILHNLPVFPPPTLNLNNLRSDKNIFCNSVGNWHLLFDDTDYNGDDDEDNNKKWKKSQQIIQCLSIYFQAKGYLKKTPSLR